ncbi:Tyrosine-protein kinase (EC [Olavius algarvensis associated proteobacterium Delta 3]|nr:Tyrosine-protein kinase (EC [Olavius algarvensis associated proteobacterium Delta 3]
MTEKEIISGRQSNLIKKDEINFLDLLVVFLNRKRLIIMFTMGAALLSLIISLLLPNMFIATARVLPPRPPKTGLFSAITQATGAIGGLLRNMEDSTTSELYVGILKSRSVADALIEKFGLKELYNMKYMTHVYKNLEKNSDFKISRDDGIISISVMDRDPRRAAEMANYYVEMLDKKNQKVNTSEGQRKREFLDKRLEKVKKDLIDAENALREFQEKYKLFSIEEQAKVAIEGAARIKSEIIITQTELEVLKQFGTVRQNEAIMLKAKIDELQDQLEGIEVGSAKNNIDTQKENEKNSNFYIPFKEIPELGLQLTRLMREAKIQEKVFEIITTEYEMAKIEEAKDVNTIQMLDNAVPPDKKSAPRRLTIVFLSTVSALLISVSYVFFIEFLNKIRKSDPAKFQIILNSVNFSRKKNQNIK